jgi:hypothetical protein
MKAYLTKHPAAIFFAGTCLLALGFVGSLVVAFVSYGEASCSIATEKTCMNSNISGDHMTAIVSLAVFYSGIAVVLIGLVWLLVLKKSRTKQ